MSKRSYCAKQIEGALSKKEGKNHNSLKQNLDGCFGKIIASFLMTV